MVKNTYEMFQTKHLINRFLYKNVFIEFSAVKVHADNVTQMSYNQLELACQNMINQTILKESYWDQ